MFGYFLLFLLLIYVYYVQIDPNSILYLHLII